MKSALFFLMRSKIIDQKKPKTYRVENFKPPEDTFRTPTKSVFLISAAYLNWRRVMRGTNFYQSQKRSKACTFLFLIITGGLFLIMLCSF